MSDDEVIPEMQLHVSCSGDKQADGTFTVQLMISNVPTQRAAQGIVNHLHEPVKAALLKAFEGARVEGTRVNIIGSGQVQ